jgi:lipopolysaccharide/colanic/teichoic acid biosynthesis glycosyltransferase
MTLINQFVLSFCHNVVMCILVKLKKKRETVYKQNWGGKQQEKKNI